MTNFRRSSAANLKIVKRKTPRPTDSTAKPKGPSPHAPLGVDAGFFPQRVSLCTSSE
jgi:hypothetical protein